MEKEKLIKILKKIALYCFIAGILVGASYVLRYAGTKAQWEAITKGTNWEPNKTSAVICTDGVIE